jgi:hypothetical protein
MCLRKMHSRLLLPSPTGNLVDLINRVTIFNAGAPRPMKLTYSPSTIVRPSIALLMSASAVGGVATLIVYQMIFRPHTLIGSPIFFLLFATILIGIATVEIAILTSFLKRHRTILISSDGIFSMKMFGGIQNAIRWAEVVKIDRIWQLDPIARQDRFFFQIHGSGNVICFDDAIRNFAPGGLIRLMVTFVSYVFQPARWIEVEKSYWKSKEPFPIRTSSAGYFAKVA